MICPHCHSENRASAKFCDECGFPLTGRIAESEADVARSGASCSGEPNGEAQDAALALEPAWERTNHHDVVLPSIDVRGLNVDENGEPFSPDSESDGEDADTPLDDDLFPRKDGDAMFDSRSDGLDVEAETDFSFDPLPSVEAHDASADQLAYNADPSLSAAERADMPQGGDVSAAETNVLSPIAASARNLWNGGSTMEMPRISDEQQGFGGYRAPEEDARKKGRGKKRRIALALVVALIVVGAVAYATWSFELWGGKAVPDVEGMTQADATAALQSDGFAVRSLQVRSDETEGLVLLTDPAAGSRVEEGSEVIIHVAIARTIPDVSSLSQDEALKRLTEAGYTRVNIQTQKSNEEDGIVLNVEPAVGEKAASTTQVTLTISIPYTVPNVVGSSAQDAQATLEAEGYAVAVSNVYTEDGNEGTVVSTSPAAGERLNSGQTVTMYVAVSRATEVVNAAYGILWAGAEVNVGGVNYQISSVDSVSYQGNDTVAYTFTGTPFTYLLGIRVELDPTTVSGTITFNDDNTVRSSSPAISL